MAALFLAIMTMVMSMVIIALLRQRCKEQRGFAALVPLVEKNCSYPERTFFIHSKSLAFHSLAALLFMI
jgi:hypothetical protein